MRSSALAIGLCVVLSAVTQAQVPPATAITGATVINGTGKFVLPGLIDTNVHLSLYGGTGDRYESLAKYHPRQKEIVLEAAQLQLKYGVTTVRDSYGLLLPLVAVREQINQGQAIGPRILAAGNIVGWGGPYSISFSLIREQGLTLFQE
jgi:imidazolonepropionase-like amidohydrolase